MKTRLLAIALLVTLTALGAGAADLYVDGKKIETDSFARNGMVYFPIEALSEATGVAIQKIGERSVQLAGSPVEFTPEYKEGRPFLPAEAFAMISGGVVERDEVRGLVILKSGPPQPAASAPPQGGPPAQGEEMVAAPTSTAVPPPLPDLENIRYQMQAMETMDEISREQMLMKMRRDLETARMQTRMFYWNQFMQNAEAYRRSNPFTLLAPMY